MSILNLRDGTVDPAFAVSGSDSLTFTADVDGPLSVSQVYDVSTLAACAGATPATRTPPSPTTATAPNRPDVVKSAQKTL